MNIINRLFLTLALLVTLLINANAQIEGTETSLTGVFNVIASSPIPPNSAIVQGFFVDQTNQYADVDVTIGDVLWDRNGNRWYISNVITNNNPMTLRLDQPSPANPVTEPVLGRGAIIREGNKYPPYIAGIDSRLNNIIQTHAMININQALSAGVSVNTGPTIQGDGTVGNPLDLNGTGAIVNDVWKWNGTNWVLGQDNDIQSLSVTDIGNIRNISIANGNTITFTVDDNDADPTNEYQNLSISGNLLSITNGNAVTIPGNDNWGTQTALVGSTLVGDGTLGNPLDIAQQGATVGQVLKWNGTSWVPDVDVSGGTVTTDITLQGDGTAGNPLGIAQQGATNNQVLKWNGTSWVPQDDSDAQTLTLNTVGTLNDIIISNGNTVTIDVADNDNDPNNEIQDIVTDGTPGNVSITSGSNLTLNVNDADADPNNELQTLSITGNQLSISSGNTVTIPGDDWGAQVAQTDATLTGDGTTLNPLSIAQQGATNGQVLKWNGTTWAPANDNTGAGGGMNSFNWTDGTTTNTITDGTTIGVVGSTEGIDATMTGNNIEVSLDLSEVATTTTVDNTFDFVGWNSTVASEQRINQADVLSWINSNVTGDNWGTQVVQTDASLSGDGTTTTPLGLAINSINDTYMDYTQVTLSDFTNDAGFITDNLYTANGTLSGNRTVDMGSFGLTFQGPSYPTVTIQSTGTTGGVIKFNGSQAGNFQIYGHSGAFFGWSSITNKDVFRYSPSIDNFDFQTNVSFDFQVKDGNNDPGTAGEILSTTGTATDWVSPSTLTLGSIDQHSDVDVTTTPPTANQVLKWDGTNWIPQNDVDNDNQTLSIVGNDLTISNGNTVTIPGNDNWGTQTVQTDATLTGDGTTTTPLSIAQQGATVGQVLKWNGSTWAPDNDNTGTGGDNLGNHTATQDLNMSNFSILNTGIYNMTDFDGDGVNWNIYEKGTAFGGVYNAGALWFQASGSTSPLMVLEDDGTLKLQNTPVLNTSNTNVLVYNSATKAIELNNGVGDNLGNHTATQTLLMSNNNISRTDTLSFQDNFNNESGLIFSGTLNIKPSIFIDMATDTTVELIVNEGSVTINESYDLPVSDGTYGQIIETDGAGILSFKNPVRISVGSKSGTTAITTGTWNDVTFTSSYDRDSDVTYGAPFITVDSTGRYVMSCHVELSPPTGVQSQVYLKAQIDVGGVGIWFDLPGSHSGTYIDTSSGLLFATGFNFFVEHVFTAGDRIRIQVYPVTGAGWDVSDAHITFEKIE